MSIFSKLKGTPACPKKPHDVAAAIIDKVPKGSTLVRQVACMQLLTVTDCVLQCEVTGPGFINIYLHKSWVAKYVEKVDLTMRPMTYLRAAGWPRSQATEGRKAPCPC